MKKALLLSLALLPIFAHADGEIVATETTTTKTKKVVIKEEQTVQPSYYQYHNRMAVMDPFIIVYERTENDAIYAGIETWLLPVDGSKGVAALAEAEFRMGYNFFYNGRDHVTPLVGVGAIRGHSGHGHGKFWKYNWGRHHHRERAFPTVVYGTLGFLYDHEFNSVFNLGFDLKGMIGGGVEKKHGDWGNPVWGLDASMPITFRFGYHRRWDIRIEPFDIYLHGKNGHANFFGFRNTLGFRF